MEIIKDFFHNIKIKFISVIDGITNLYKWLPIIWHDRDFDYYYLLVILKKKLNNMSEHFEKSKVQYEGIENDNEDIKKCVKLLDNIMNETHMEKMHDNMDEKWGEINLSFNKTENGMYKLNTNRPNVITEEDDEELSKDLRNGMEWVGKKEQEEINDLMETLKNFKKWWI